jgi:prevent-host-death family protein
MAVQDRTQVNVHEAKTHLSRLIERALSGERIIIARAGKPCVELTPVQGPPKRRMPGIDEGKIFVHDDWDDPIPELEEMTWGHEEAP